MNLRQNAAAVIENSEGLILACERRNIRGAWQVPQGGIDEDEGAEDAVLREVREETGIESKFLKIIAKSSKVSYLFPRSVSWKTNKGKYDGQEQVYFHLKIADSGWKLAEETEEFVAFEWITKREMIERIVPFKKDCYIKAFKELFGEDYEN
ncbi:NUDIX domain-containing protein [bacterium]|nr:NUDIX domain-containing protein [bacterium]